MNDDSSIKLPLRAAYPFGAAHDLEREMNEIHHMRIKWREGSEISYTTSLKCGYVIDLFEKHGIFEDFKTNHWPIGNTPAGETKRLFYLRIKQQYDGSPDSSEPDVLPDEAEDIEDADQEFPLEAHLRDFLNKNPSCIEPGLKIYEANNRHGKEYAIEGGFIDLLAVDRDQRFVVIELKLGRGRNKAIGQLSYYMAWVDKNLGIGGRCRGMIIAKDIPDDLLLAVQRVPDVSLHRYNLSVSIEQVPLKS